LVSSEGDETVPLQLILVAVVGLMTLGVAGPATAASARFNQSPAVGHVYVNANTARENTIAAFDRHADRTLTPLPGSPFAAGGAGTGDTVGSQDALRVTSDGRFLFTINTLLSSVSRYEILADGSLDLLGSTTLNDPTGLRPIDVRVAPDGEHLYVLGADAGVVSILVMDSGNLTELPVSPVALPEGTTPFGIAVT